MNRIRKMIALSGVTGHNHSVIRARRSSKCSPPAVPIFTPAPARRPFQFCPKYSTATTNGTTMFPMFPWLRLILRGFTPPCPFKHQSRHCRRLLTPTTKPLFPGHSRPPVGCCKRTAMRAPPIGLTTLVPLSTTPRQTRRPKGIFSSA